MEKFTLVKKTKRGTSKGKAMFEEHVDRLSETETDITHTQNIKQPVIGYFGLVAIIAKRTELRQAVVREVLDTFSKVVLDELAKEHTVQLKDLFKISLVPYSRNRFDISSNRVMKFTGKCTVIKRLAPLIALGEKVKTEVDETLPE